MKTVLETGRRVTVILQPREYEKLQKLRMRKNGKATYMVPITHIIRDLVMKA